MSDKVNDPKSFDILTSVRAAEQSVSSTQTQLDEVMEQIEQMRIAIKETITKRIEESKYTKFNPDFLDALLEEPYAIVPRREEKGIVTEWYVIVPKMIDFQLGWLDRSTKSFNIFLVNKYIKWFSEVPQEIAIRFHEQPLQTTVRDGLLLVDENDRETAWNRYKPYLLNRAGSGAIRIKRGSEFDLIASIINDGTLPFTAMPVNPSDLRDFTTITLRDYQEVAWSRFMQYGAVGVYYPFGTGKSFLGIYVCGRVKGAKLVVVPTITLKEQWNERLKQYGITDVAVETYHAFAKVKNTAWNLVVFDEHQHLPANTFIRLSTLKTKYRIGFSGSPYREDGRVNYIIALTGFPVGLAWEKFFELGIIHKPTVTLKIVNTAQDKLSYLTQLLNLETGKTLIFCDSLDLGEKIAREHGLEFVYGQTKHRLDLIRDNEKIVISRVGDEGLSVPDIDTVIEYDFLFGSRMQESQRSGRLLHSEKLETNHYIIMTEDELDRYGKRLYALYERGYQVNIIR